MKLRILAGAAMSAMLFTGVMASVSHVVAPAAAGSRTDAQADKKAAGHARKAEQAIAKKQWGKAVTLAEAAVALNPDDAGYRALLGSAYLKAGRFASAEQSFADVMTLQPDNGRISLNLALAQIAEGKWAAARDTLDAHSGTIPAADRGLALALAGDPATAVEVLTAATRAAQADVKTRQNLALAMALAGRWPEARALVGVDMTPVDADARMVQWAAFAQPRAASDQVATLLGVTPAADPGQPAALALAGAAPVVAETHAPVDAFMPGRAEPEVETAAVEAAPVAPVPVAVAPMVAAAAPVAPMVTAAPVAAPSTAQLIAAASTPYKTPLARVVKAKPAVAWPAVARAVSAKGSWYVQIGAFRNAAVAQDSWKGATRRFPALAAHDPFAMNASVNGATYYRLSVGGFTRADAVSLCQRYRAKGGVCFVRAGAGDQIASWYRQGGKGGAVQLASR
jgi:Flp pilus assembly protein TadD